MEEAALFDFLEKNFGKHVDRAASLASAQGYVAFYVALTPPRLPLARASSDMFSCLLCSNPHPPDRLLGTHEAELGRISALLNPEGTVGSQVAAKLAAVQQREQELRAVEVQRAELEQRMRTFSGVSRPPRPPAPHCR